MFYISVTNNLVFGVEIYYFLKLFKEFSFAERKDISGSMSYKTARI